MRKILLSSRKKLPELRAAHAYLDVTCSLVRLPGGTSRVILSFRDWANGGGLSCHNDFATEAQALDSIGNAIALFCLRRSPGRDEWRNTASPGFRRAIGRVAGRARRTAASAENQPQGVVASSGGNPVEGSKRPKAGASKGEP